MWFCEVISPPKDKKKTLETNAKDIQADRQTDRHEFEAVAKEVLGKPLISHGWGFQSVKCCDLNGV